MARKEEIVKLESKLTRLKTKLYYERKKTEQTKNVLKQIKKQLDSHSISKHDVVQVINNFKKTDSKNFELLTEYRSLLNKIKSISNNIEYRLQHDIASKKDMKRKKTRPLG